MKMIDIVLDSDHLAEFFIQYFNPDIANHGRGKFQAGKVFSEDLARRLNDIVAAVPEGISNLVIASTFALIEIARNWDTLVGSRFSVQQLHAFVYQHPEWFSLAPVDEDLMPFFVDVPSMVLVGSKPVPIEWTDAIHLATVISRGVEATLATNDTRAIKVLEQHGRVLL